MLLFLHMSCTVRLEPPLLNASSAHSILFYMSEKIGKKTNYALLTAHCGISAIDTAAVKGDRNTT